MVSAASLLARFDFATVFPGFGLYVEPKDRMKMVETYLRRYELSSSHAICCNSLLECRNFRRTKIDTWVATLKMICMYVNLENTSSQFWPDSRQQERTVVAQMSKISHAVYSICLFVCWHYRPFLFSRLAAPALARHRDKLTRYRRENQTMGKKTDSPTLLFCGTVKK